jgi:hypothetical protein
MKKDKEKRKKGREKDNGRKAGWHEGRKAGCQE